MLYENLGVNARGHLTFAGIDTLELASEFGTPLYVLDENRVRDKCRAYVSAFADYLPAGSTPLFASKALCFKGIYPIVASEGLGADVVSAAEAATAIAAGFDPDKLYFHGTNKTDAEIRYGVDVGIGCFVVDNENELEVLSAEAGKCGVRQRVLLRLTVGIDPHTFAAVRTGQVDSQFGVPIDTGQALEFCQRALTLDNLDVIGFHSHIGSQIFDASSFCDQVDRLLDFARDLREACGYVASVFNLGGGFGVPYVEGDPTLDIRQGIEQVAAHLREGCARYDYPLPRIMMEPGRSIVADAGCTLYTAGGVKNVRGYRDYVTVDGGMCDNPRFALYRSAYTIVNATHADAPADFTCTVAGRCCESGDRLAEDIRIARPERGDIICVLTTGAYNFSMSSNYNRVLRPALVIVRDGRAHLSVRRQTLTDLLALER